MSDLHVLYGSNGEQIAGVASREEFDLLNKALVAGYDNGTGSPQNLTGGATLIAESLDASMRSTTWQMRNLVLWPSLPMERAFSTVEQYTRITSYGSNGSAYFTEGGSPREEDTKYNRDFQRVVYFGTRRRVSHPMMLVRTNYGDAVAREINSGNMWLLQHIERELYKGNGDYSNGGDFDGNSGAIPEDTLGLNGLDQQIRAGDSSSKAKNTAFNGYEGLDSVVRSLEGGLLTEDEMENGAISILNNFGVPIELHSDPTTLSQFSRQFFPKERINEMGVLNGRAGFVLTSFASSAGEFALRPSVFLNPKKSPLTQGENGDVPPRPAQPTSATSTTASGVVTTFELNEVYLYKVAAVNEAGESAASVTQTVTIAADGDVVDLVISHSGLSNFKEFAVYRSTAGGAESTCAFIGRVTAGGTSTTFRDKNKRVPGAASAYLLFLDPDSISFRQLTPLSKINLATVAASIEWIQVLYGTLLVYTPRKNFIYENIGRQA